MRAASPCTGICKIDQNTGWCLGCGRSRFEMDAWRKKSEKWRQSVWAEIPSRLNALEVTCRRFPWTTQDIKDFVYSSLENCEGTWVMGVVGAVAEFRVLDWKNIHVECSEDTIIAFTKNGALKMLINDDVRPLNFDKTNKMAKPRVVLAVKRDRGRLPTNGGVSDLGEDQHALIAEHAKKLYDLGLNRKEARFCVRVTESASEDILNKFIGQSFEESIQKFAVSLINESPTRVVETALGRIEVQGKIPSPNENSPSGPHTHLMLDHLTSKRALPVGMELPRAYLPGAIFYPAD